MIKLSDTQRAILKAAAKEPKTDVREHMGNLKSPAIRNKVTESMLKNGLIMEDADAEGVSYVISEAGLAAIGKKQPAQDKPAKEIKPKREGSSKKQLMIDMLSRKEGVTLKQLMDGTGWLKHSVHGGLANLKTELQEKNGQTIVASKEDGEERVYKILSMKESEKIDI